MNTSKASSRHVSDDEENSDSSVHEDEDEMISEDESEDGNQPNKSGVDSSSLERRPSLSRDSSSIQDKLVRQRLHDVRNMSPDRLPNINKTSERTSPKSPHKKTPNKNNKHVLDTKKANSENESSHIIDIKSIAFIVIFIITVIILIYFSLDPTDSLTTDENVKDRKITEFENDLHLLKADFPNQSKKFWRILVSATKSIIYNNTPADPAVILMAIPGRGLERTVDCFIDRYSYLTTAFFNQTKRDVVKFNFTKSPNQIPPSTLKIEIDEKLNKSFSTGIHLAIFEHLEFLASEAAMMFHGYCDNDNAPFKRVFMIMTLYLHQIKKNNHKHDTSILRDNSNELDVDSITNEKDGYVEEMLRRLWGKEVGDDTFASLMSRIANSIVFFKQEQDEVLNKYC